MYNIRLLDQSRHRIAVIEAPASWRYTRRPSEATEISLTLPREHMDAALPAGMDAYAVLSPVQAAWIGTHPGTVTAEPKHRRARIGRYVEIYRGATHVVTGRITKVDIGADTITLQCHTEEIELESAVTPAQYGRVWDDWDLADVARDLLHGWHVLRVKDKSQWDAAIDRSNVDTSTEPGVVMLAKSGGRYVASGYITVRFEKADVPGFVRWDRIRWASDNGALVRTTMQWRADGGAWSQEIEGTYPDEVGVLIGAATADVVDVRINLYTDDRETQGPDGTPIGQTPFVFAVEVIARTTVVLEAGDIPASTGVRVSGIEADCASALNVLSQACAQVGWEFWVQDGKLNIAERMGQDRTSSVLLRAGTNMTVTTLSEGDEELVNVLTALGPGDGINRLQVVRRHEESIARYGEHHGVQEFEHVTTLAELVAAADAYLEQHAAPVSAYRVDVQYPYGMEPEYGVGDYVRVADPRNGIITRARIVEEQRSYSTGGLRVTLFLGMPAPSLARQIKPSLRPRDTEPPDDPEGVMIGSIIRGIVVEFREPRAPDWAMSRVRYQEEGSSEWIDMGSGRQTRFTKEGLDPSKRYRAQVQHIDHSGNRSAWVTTGYVQPEDVTIDELPPDIIERVHLVYGSVSSIHMVRYANEITTDSTSWVDMPGMYLPITLDDRARLIIMASAPTDGRFEIGMLYLKQTYANVRLVVDGQVVEADQNLVTAGSSLATLLDVHVPEGQTRTVDIKLQWRKTGSSTVIKCSKRHILAFVVWR